ncbi:hypothetical protein EJB05_57875 [Eragrostis curvula]|uniref:Exportin-5 C-terminal domain-containing protein n=1 Tax=Eragrostis curvula TaxID=38414 RepID=A0A5J9SCV3_9POAL|nr:hypothetical protein EJB05_57875 [Eragrostis curvula]
MDAAATAELELQSPMEIHTFECDGDGGSYGIRQNDNSDADYSEKSNEAFDKRKRMEFLRFMVEAAVLAVVMKRCLSPKQVIGELLKQHAAVSKRFLSAATGQWFETANIDVLASALNSLNDIWTQPDWEAFLEILCCYGEFRMDLLNIFKFFEEELKTRREETNKICQTDQTSYSALISLVQSIIPLALKLLRFIHALWSDGADYRLPEELKEAKSYYQNFYLLGETLELQKHDVEVNELGRWMQLIRESGYNLLGLCAPINGAFSELLDSLSIYDAIMKNLRSMEFRHVTKLIDLIILPFVKHCPRKLWHEWMLKLLLPLFSYCEDMLYYSWFSLLNNGRANVPYYFGHLCGPEETIKKLEDYLLLDFTRKVSKLLGALASPELNTGIFQVDLHSPSDMISASCDLICSPSSCIVGYLLLNGCFGRLSMNLFGWWVDVEATIAVVPFCSALVQVIDATNNEKLRQFAKDDILPALIRRLHDDLPCAIQRTIKKLSYQMNLTNNNKARTDLMILCQKAYRVCVQSQDLESENLDNANTTYGFENWFEKQKADLSVKAAWTRPDEFPSSTWTWEVPECPNQFEEEFQRHLDTYIDLLHEVDAMDDCLEVSDTWGTAMLCLKENFHINLDHYEIDAEYAVDMFFDSILLFWEPQFHPLIREGQMDTLSNIARQLVLAEDSKCYKPLEVDPNDFVEHLWPYAHFYFYRKRKECGYFTAREQVKVHKKFDAHLSSGVLDADIYKFSLLKDDFVKKFVAKHIARSEFAGLSPKLLKLSLEGRAQIVHRKRQIDAYCKCLKHVMTDEKVKDRLKSLMSKLESEDFFDVSNNSIDWGKRSIQKLIDDFKEIVFRVHAFPRYLVIQGIMDYWEISRRVCVPLEDSFKEVVEVVSHRWREDLQQIWMDTRYYDDSYYDLRRQPLNKIFTQKVKAPMPTNRRSSKRSSRLRLKRQN